MTGISVYELIGYTASAVVLISLVMSSIIRLRWINLAGSVIFMIYGILIAAIPVVFMNLITVFINLYYLIKIYNRKEHFKLIFADTSSDFYRYFIKYYSEEIKEKFPDFDPEQSKGMMGFFVFRDMSVSGIFMYRETEEKIIRACLDYVVPEYRDFKVGDFIFRKNKKFFTEKGYKKVISYSENPSHEKYLLKMGFRKNCGSEIYEKALT